MSTHPPVDFHGTSGQAYCIFSLQPGDAAALVDYIRAVLSPCEYFVTQLDEYTETHEQARDRIQQHLDASGCLMLRADCEGRMVGLLVFTGGTLQRVAHCGSFHITVHPDFRGQGIGRELLKALLDWATANPAIRKVALTVMATNHRALKLYREFGFIEEGRKVGEVQMAPGVFVDDVLMYRLVK